MQGQSTGDCYYLNVWLEDDIALETGKCKYEYKETPIGKSIGMTLNSEAMSAIFE